MTERTPSRDPSKKTKTGLENLGGDLVGTITLAEYRRLRDTDTVHVVQPERTRAGGTDAA